MPWNDARVIVEVAESLVADGTLDVASGTPLGRPGKLYSPHALLPSLIHVPGAILAAWLSPHWPEAAPQLRVLFAHLGPAAMAALACLLLFHLARSFGASATGATLGAITLGVGTLLAIYARSPGTEAVEAACFTGFFWWLARVVESPTRRNAIGLGVWAGLLVNSKIVFALSLPGAALVAAILHWDNAFRIEREARPQWLGQPNRAGALAPDRGGYCDPCLEDLYALHWLPPFQPLAMNAWILLAKASGKNAIEAAADAPWTRYTRLPIGVAGSYPRARLDWWLLEWKGDLRPRAFALFGLLAAALAASALLWNGRLRLPTFGRSRAAPAHPAAES